MFSGVGNSTFDRDIAALRSRLLIFCQDDAETTPVLRTEEPHAPKVRRTSFLLTVHSRFLFDVSKRKWGCILATKGRPLAFPVGKKTKKYAPVPWYWDESEHTLRGATQIQDRLSPLASCYGEGAVGVSAPAPPLSFVWSERETFSLVSLSVDRWSEYCCGICAVDFPLFYAIFEQMSRERP